MLTKDVWTKPNILHNAQYSHAAIVEMAIRVRVTDPMGIDMGTIFYLRVAPVSNPNWDELRRVFFPTRG
jgi:hypothetical protein